LTESGCISHMVLLAKDDYYKQLVTNGEEEAFNYVADEPAAEKFSLAQLQLTFIILCVGGLFGLLVLAYERAQHFAKQ